MSKKLFGKYKEIVWAVALFVALDAMVLLLNVYMSFQIADGAHAIQLASKQSMLSQKIFLQASAVRDDLKEQRDFTDSADKLSVAFKQFEEILDSFIYGGELIGQGQGQDSLLTKTKFQDLSTAYLLDAEQLWLPYRGIVNSIVYAEYDSGIDRSELLGRAERAVEYANKHSDALLGYVQSFALAIERETQQKTRGLRAVEALGIVLAIINFFLIVFHFLRKIEQGDQNTAKARKETEEILNNVNDGLFLLGKDQKIGIQHSGSMKTLFKRDDLAGLNFIELLKSVVDETTLETAKDYVDLLFRERVKSTLMSELNPLQEVEINLSEQGSFSKHYFCFHFSRVYEQGKLVHLLVTVSDITEMIKLRNELKKNDQKTNQELEFLLAIIHLDHSSVAEFISSLESNIGLINRHLEQSGNEATHLQQKIDAIFRITHALKSEASALNIRFVVEKLHAMEEYMVELKRKDANDVVGDDFLPLAVELNKLIHIQQLMKSVSKRNFSKNETSHSPQQLTEKPEQALERQLSNLIVESTKDSDKRVRLNMSDFNMALVPDSALLTVKESLIQFVRNAVVHGLEPTQERRHLGKHEIGTITISTLSDEFGHLRVKIRDDGRGLDLQTIKNKLMQYSQLSEEAVKKMSASRLLGFMFKPGFSTASTIDHHAGRGVGLDIVRNSLTRVGASLSVCYQDKKFTEFCLQIPLNNKMRVKQVA
ncbi:MAG: ATP-binding protein [Arenicella sp.]